MNDIHDLQYDSDSFAGPFQEDRLLKFQEYLNATSSATIAFDPAYIDHLRRFHGGIPGKRFFKTASGMGHAIVRFLNFAACEHVLGDYGVNATWSSLAERFGDTLIPFAELFAGDYLCFDHSRSTVSRVVVWLHEESREDAPCVEPVADTFEQFLAMLSETSSDFTGPHLSDDVAGSVFRLCCEGDDFLEEETRSVVDDAVIQALECYTCAQRLLPPPITRWVEAAQVFAGLGNAHFFAQSYADAIAAFKTALETPGGSDCNFVHIRLAQCYLELGNEAEASREFRAGFESSGILMFEDEDSKYLDFIKTLDWWQA